MAKLFRFSLPQIRLPGCTRTVGVYISGALLSLAVWCFLDVAIYSRVRLGGVVHINIIDWLPGIASILGMIIINSIDRGRLLMIPCPLATVEEELYGRHVLSYS